MSETKIVTITDPADWREGDTAERVWPDGSLTRGTLRKGLDSMLRIGQSSLYARYPSGALPLDDSTITVTREVPNRVLPTEPGSLVLVFRLRGETLDPPVVAVLYIDGDWFTPTPTPAAGRQYHDPADIEEWSPATILPTEDVERAREIVEGALRKVMLNDDWATVSGDDLRSIRDALTEVQA